MSQSASRIVDNIPYRAQRSETASADGSFTWAVSYDQTKRGDWSPRGRFEERDGMFIVRGRDLDSADLALAIFARGY